jgi:signal transduction histidine kinase
MVTSMTATSDQAGSIPLIAQRLVDEMGATSELLVGVHDLTEVLKRVASRAKEIANAEYAAISTFDENDTLDRFVYAGIGEDLARHIGHPPVGRGLLGDLVRHVRPLMVEDLQSHSKYTGWPEGHPDMVAFLGVPIRAGGRTIGSLYMTRTRGAEPFSPADELAATLMAMQAAVSVSVALARGRKDRLSLLEERERIAHDLHDGTIQALYALGLEVDSLTTLPGVDEPSRESLRTCVGRINDLISDIRTYITALEAETPEGPADLGRDLAFIVRRLVPAGIDVVMNTALPAIQELSPREVEDLIYIAREAISNAVRHGSPTKIAVDLRQRHEEVALTIQDNGVGYDPEHVRRGLGTITMRTRAERLGAEINVLSIPGMGTTVRVVIPREADYE